LFLDGISSLGGGEKENDVEPQGTHAGDRAGVDAAQAVAIRDAAEL